MTYMLCRNRVANFAKWKKGFDSHAAAHDETGLKLERMWRDTADKNNVFFMFEVLSMKKAQAFITAPEAAEAGRKFGVLEGEYHFIRNVAIATPNRKKPARKKLLR
jgi:hypothetical protein